MTTIHESGNLSAFENLVAVYIEGGRSLALVRSERTWIKF